VKYFESLDTFWSNNITLLVLIKATEVKELWKHVFADNSASRRAGEEEEEEEEDKDIVK